MSKTAPATLSCEICKKPKSSDDGMLADLIRPSLLEFIKSLHQHEILASNIEEQFERKLTFGERLSDHIASFGGSWRFISLFGAVLFGWIILNGILLLNRGFDPYPFILLNLILSCLAAIQAPIIMMSQNRSEARDRLRA